MITLSNDHKAAAVGIPNRQAADYVQEAQDFQYKKSPRDRIREGIKNLEAREREDRAHRIIFNWE